MIPSSIEVIALVYQKVILRVDHDLTQQVADILGCKREVYRRYEKGARTIPVDFLIKLADYYGVSVDHILGRE